ncbi:MAG: glycogen/starch/alpha-glucan family phosphorylase [Lachnospiraceae bacterium]|nr:glycogen/starch/alpha-glucan family phosphorylase [Lachnospiraceae bacterium]
MKKTIKDYTKKPLKDCTKLELFNALLNLVSDRAQETGYNEGKKKIYYISAEFLIGKLLGNNLINLGIYEDVKKELEAEGLSLTELEEFEDEPSLGNGGLGRLAACFIDSLATLGLPADGIGLAYHCGLFKQSFTDGKQYETPDKWLTWGKESWMKRSDKHYKVRLGDAFVTSTMYEIAVTGYNNKCTTLRLFDLDTIDERLIKSSINFDKNDYLKNLTLFLYPDDSDEAGRILRVYQEYFMVSNAAQWILDECIAKGSNLHDLADYAAIQINDTHPSMVIPELIRLLTERGIDEKECYEIVTKVCAYTNHTILAEALETWPGYYLESAVPELVPIIERLNREAAKRSDDPFVQIIDENKNVHMANMDIHFSHSINGVAKLHTEILKNSELAPFFKLYPEKFNNKTNGITFRRWLKMCNPELSAMITAKIGENWVKDADELEKLGKITGNDPDISDKNISDEVLTQILEIKSKKKRDFANWLESAQGVKVDPESVFDVQAKRLHEYKRQQLNLLWAIAEYKKIKKGEKPVRPITVFFGAKAAPAYRTAKDIIHAIITFGRVVENDPKVSPYLKVVMLENYNVSLAEKLIPAADISEQISLASKEASGTGNMKFMLNGAVTLGTEDGANVEIAELVGNGNIYIFGQKSDEVIEHYRKADYVAADWYRKNRTLKAAVDFLTGKEMLKYGDEEALGRLQNELIGKDWFMTFPDFEEYCKVKQQVLNDYEDRLTWAKKMLVNISKAGFFSSDRTIRQYNEEIWKL